MESITRRRFFLCSGLGIGSIAIATLLNSERIGRLTGSKPMEVFAPKDPHFSPMADNVIFLSMAGGPSQLDLFDYKPELQKFDGTPCPESFLENRRFPFLEGVPNLLASPYHFNQYGQAGIHISEQLPNLTQVVDDLTFIKSMTTDEINHVPAQLLLNTGFPRQGRPSMGSWITYGLGSQSSDLPGYIVLSSGKAGRCGSACWGSGFLPSSFQGVQFRTAGDSVPFLTNPAGVDGELRRESLDTINALNREAYQEWEDPEIETRINAFEMAFRMQTSVPELMDISSEPKEIHEMYGTQPWKVSFSNNCLLARRLVERGVRFVHLVHGGWDHHGGRGDQNLVTNLPARCQETDKAAAALIKDLGQRGLLERTMVIWGGEFGRTPMLQGKATKKELGRDHLNTAFTIWIAGGGIKKGFSLGITDEIGMNAVKDAFHVHDLQATLLYALGLDHKRLTYRHQGRDFRLTDVGGNVIKEIFA